MILQSRLSIASEKNLCSWVDFFLIMIKNTKQIKSRYFEEKSMIQLHNLKEDS